MTALLRSFIRSYMYLAPFSIGITVLPSGVTAQTTDAAITGVVTDQTGAVVPDAVINVQNVATGVTSRTTSNAAGVYLFPALVPGAYTLRAERQGFKAFSYEQFDLDIRAQAKLDVHLEVGGTAESVQVTAEAAQLNLSNANIGTVVQGKQILDLPLQARSALDFLSTVGGVAAGTDGSNINGNRAGAVNLTLDGLNVNENLVDGLTAVTNSAGFSVDRIEEIRVITSPADAELGRGSAQIQLISRGGTNVFHGSLFEENRNTLLTANNWFNNSHGVNPVTHEMVSPRPVLIRNQYGGRVGGPIVKNKTFFNFTYEGERRVSATPTNSVVYTQSARQGIFRYFPGVRNANAASTTTPPVVTTGGDPVQPAAATGPLQNVNVLTLDPTRAQDPTGTMAAFINKYMPLPNNFLVGDGLNTAGFAFNAPTRGEVSRYVLRLDHQLLNNTRLALNMSKERIVTVFAPVAYPTEPPSISTPNSQAIYSLSVTTVIHPNLINELLIGVNRPRQPQDAPIGTYRCTFCNAGIYPKAANGSGNYQLRFTPNIPLTPLSAAVGPFDGNAPTYQYGDSITWLRGKHAYKTGATLRFISNHGYNIIGGFPTVTLGAGSVGLSPAVALPGIGQNQTPAGNLLADLAGDVANVNQSLYSFAGGPFQSYVSRYRHWQTKEFAWFLKDDWKVTPNLTLNLGVRYELYGVWHEHNGNGQLILPTPFGISGSTYAAMFSPGAAQPGGAALYTVLASQNGFSFYNPDLNNFMPAVGLAYSLPWLGKGKTVLRAGYGWAYQEKPAGLFTALESPMPGLTDVVNINPGVVTNLAGITVPVAPDAPVLGPIPFNRSAPANFFDRNLRVPYIQNYSISIGRVFPGNWSVDVRFIGSKGTRLIRTVDLNEVNIFENGILDAFNITQAGGNAPLFNRIFDGLSIGGSTVGANNFTGSDYLRANTATQPFLANNNVAGLANFINTSTFPGVPRGGLLSRAGLPENFIVVNPQGSATSYMTNDSNSTYNSLQVEVDHRFSSGFLVQSNFTWSKALTDANGTAAVQVNPRTNRNLRLDKALAPFDRTAVWRSNGIWELPFGNGKPLLSGASGIVGRIVGGWQTSVILTVQDGGPFSVTGTPGTFNSNLTSGDTPVVTGDIGALGGITFTGSGVTYFSGLKQVPDPSRANITTVNSIRNQSTLLAIADAKGSILLANSAPGQLGNLAMGVFRGPGLFNIDVNLVKRVRITERVGLQLQADALSLTNTPQFVNPTTANSSINSTSFGNIVGLNPIGTGGARVIVLKARINF
jgi:hypothetical protein